ncbi:MAG: 2-amino-4-hydroxy-6-hydroxymethyldihydropteridine diphosphokinase [Candidatus Eremiobacteraeota bacterium]|nr:2-amino-4-hydroxy-6-hydroxymethyldihydropteridine diphosphokinase [Candidatus Eremiobacteraeota bacterium]
MERAAIGIGSNLGDPAQHVERALERLRELGTVAARSRLYRSEPWGDRDQPAFVNAAALLDTALEPEALLAALKGIERDAGRVRSRRWGPRALDLDVLLYGERSIAMQDLVVPHPRLLERAFALVPLAEIDPRFREARDRLPPGERAGVVELRAR